MQVSIISKNYGRQTIDSDNTFSVFNENSTVFKIVEHLFNEWFKHNTEPGAPMRESIEGMYYGDCDQPATCDIRGAIEDGIEIALEEIRTLGKKVISTKDFLNMDIESAFS